MQPVPPAWQKLTNKPVLAAHQHEAKFGQARAETASWLVRVQQ